VQAEGGYVLDLTFHGADSKVETFRLERRSSPLLRQAR
jgi:hypothetical protein